MKVIIYEPEKRDRDFYAYIGPYALDQSVTQELHDLQYGAIYDKPYATWFIAIDETNNELLGFATLFDKPKEIVLDNFYIVPNQRGKGFAKKLFAVRMERAVQMQGARKIKAITKNEIQYQIYLSFGMKLSSKRGKYYWCVKEGM